MELTEAFRVLASADRQYALHVLLERDEEITVASLTREVAARRHRTVPEKLTDAEVERARIRLVHTHLPCLAEMGIVEVDWADGTVEPTDGEARERIEEAAEELEWRPPDRGLKRSQ